MQNERKILAALQAATTAAVAASIVPALPIKFLGRTFVVPSDQKYLEVVYIPNNVLGEFWGDGKTYRGIYRLLLHWQNNDQGAYLPVDVLASIAGHFTKGAIFPLEALQISVKIYEQPDFMGLIEAGTDLLFGVSMRYMSFQPPA